jgi:hypothetical protein
MTTFTRSIRPTDDSVVGTLSASSDRDVYTFALTAGLSYQFDLEGLGTGGGTLATPALQLLTNSGNSTSSSVTLPTPGDERLTFTPSVSGTYQLGVTGSSSGSYFLVSAPADDYSNQLGTTATIPIGSSLVGALQTVADSDLFAVTLTAGFSYQFDLMGSGTGAGTIGAPTLGLVTSSNSFANTSTSLPTPGDRRLTYTAAATGTYYLSVSGTGQGNYTLVSAAQDDYSNLLSTTTTLADGGTLVGGLQTVNDDDAVAVTLRAGFAYQFDLFGQGSGSGSIVAPVLSISTSNGSFANGSVSLPNPGDRRLTFTPSTSGTYILDVSGGSTGSYTLVSAPHDDYSSSVPTTVTLTVGHNIKGGLQTVNDADTFNVTLAAGTTYQFDVLGAGTGGGTITSPSINLVTSTNASTGTSATVPSTGDSRLLYTPRTTGTYVLSVTGTGPGTYTLYSPSSPGIAYIPPRSLDFTGDGKSDLLIQTTTGAGVIATTNGLSVTNATSLGNPGPAWHIVGSADFNGDDQADVLFQNDDGHVIDFLMNRTGITQGVDLGNSGSNWHVRGTGDFNSDGKADILLQSDGGAMVVLETNGTNLIAGALIGFIPSGWGIEAVADFNGDGRPDILVQSVDGTLVDFTMNGTNVASGDVVANFGKSYSVAGTGDYNGDGKADIILHNDIGVNIVLMMNGPTPTSSVFAGNPGANYTNVVTGADLDGNGTADLVVQDRTTSTIIGYTLDSNAGITAGAVLGTPGVGSNVIGSNPISFIDGAGANLVATPGQDQFVMIAAANGAHTITGFDAAQDSLALNIGVFPSVATVQANEVPYNGGTFIGLSATSAVVIAGVTPDQLNAGNFVLR